MRVGRSLSPGKVFFEQNGVLRKVDPDQISRSRSLKKSGWQVVGRSLIQWGVSDSVITVDDIIFPQIYASPPNVTSISSDNSFVEIRNITVYGFQIVTQAPRVDWAAAGDIPQ